MAFDPNSRDSAGRFKKGFSGNPKGGPVSPLRAIFWGPNPNVELDQLRKLMLKRLHSKDIDTSDFATLLKIYLDRTLGKPTQHVELSGPDGHPIESIDLSKLTVDQIKAVREAQRSLEADNADNPGNVEGSEE